MSDGFNYTLQHVEDLVTREFGWDGRMTDQGEFLCYCPVHGDKNASLHVGLKNGKILIRCWSHGCEKQIYEDLSKRGAWPQQLESRAEAEKQNRAYEKKYPERVQPTRKWNSIPVTHAEAIRYSKKIRDTITMKDTGGRPAIFHMKMMHVYTDGDFAHSIVARYDCPGHKKRIFQHSFGWYDEHEDPVRPTDPNNPKWQIKGWSSKTKHMLYALTYLRSYPEDTVVIVEGEKAADYGNSQIKTYYHDHVFTTWKGGTQAIDFTDWLPLQGRKVVIIPDADEPGVFAGESVYEKLKPIAREVSIVDVMSLRVPEKWDIADYPMEGHNAPRFNQLVQTIKGESTRPKDEEDEDAEHDFLAKRLLFPYSLDGAHREQALDYFNSQYGKLYEGGKLSVVAINDIKHNPESAIIPEQVFHSANQHVKIQIIEKGAFKSASKFWLSNDHRSFDRAVVNPSKPMMFYDKKEKSCINLWPGIAAQDMDQSGSCEKFLEHLEFICSGEQNPKELHTFILTFFARMVQQPENRQGAILLLRGNQGSGKSIVGEYLRHMLGDKAAMTINKIERITGQFNAQLTGKLLCRIEEAKVRKNSDYETLKDLSVNPTFTMEAKGKSQVTRNNFIHFIVTGNFDYIAPVAERERRLVPVDVPDDKIDDVAYFDDLIDEMKGSGPGALYKYLMEYKLPADFLRIPQSNALESQRSQTKAYSRESVFLDWYAKSLKNKGLQSGPQGPSFVSWRQGEEHDRSLFWDTFNAWQKENARPQEHLTRRMFYNYFEQFHFGVGRAGRKITNVKRGRFESRYSGTQLLTFPNLLNAKDTFMKHVGEDDTFDVFSKDDAQNQMFEQEKEDIK